MTTQATHSYDAALADARTATASAQALANHWQAIADAQRAQLDLLWLARSHADYQIGVLTGERDELARQLAALERRLAEA
jgi:hypothetical protein